MPNKPRSTLALIPLKGDRAISWETSTMLNDCTIVFAREGARFSATRVAGFDQAQARAELLARFLANPEYDDALFVDADIHTLAPFVVDVARLEEPLVVVPYERKDDKGNDWTVTTAGEAWGQVREGKQMMPIDGSGMGFVRIRRSVVTRMLERFGNDPALNWISHHPETIGLPVCGLFEPIVHEYPPGCGTRRRRPEDMSFFERAHEAGVKPFALLDVPIWHDMRGGRTFLQGLLEQQRELAARRRRVHLELQECPDDLLGLSTVLDGAYDIHSLSLREPKILDIGANIGAFAVWAAARFPGAEIECYEPHPRMADLCRLNAPSAEVRECAVVGKIEGATIRLHDGELNQGERSVRPVAGVHRETFTDVCQMAAADLPYCDILKIDTEGCEREILENYPHLDGVKAIMAEWHSGDDYVWMRAWLREKGFICAVDRARGRACEDREICFVRKGVMIEAREVHA